MTDEKGCSEDLLKTIEKRRRLREKEQLSIGWYFWLLSEYPSLVIFLCCCLSCVLTVVNVLYTDRPDFTQPAKGFEVRGGELADKLVTWHNLVNHTSSVGKPSCDDPARLSVFPCVPRPLPQPPARREGRRKQRRRRRKKRRRRQFYDDDDDVISYRDDVTDDVFIQPSTSVPYTWNFTDQYFCKNPKRSYARWIFEPATPGQQLWTVDGMRSMCDSEQRLLNHSTYPSICHHSTLTTCCPTLSLPNYVAYLSGLARCEQVDAEALTRAEAILSRCEPFYCNGTLRADCWSSPDRAHQCGGIPAECTEYNAVYSVLHFLLDRSAVCRPACGETNQSACVSRDVARTMVFVPAYAGRQLLPMYSSRFAAPAQLSDGRTRVTGIDFEIEGWVFASQLVYDVIYPSVAACLVLLVLVVYTGSVFVTAVGGVFATASSMSVAYFVYTVVLDFTFFPFLNLVSALVMVGLGADNVIMYRNAWLLATADDMAKVGGVPAIRQFRRHPLSTRVGVVARGAWHHVARSLAATALTTSVAFFANFSSHVTAIRCFAVFTGLAVACNLLMSLTLLPAAIIFHHKHFSFAASSSNHKRASRFAARVSDAARVWFDHVQVLLIVRARWLWTVLFAAVAAGAVYLLVTGVRLADTGAAFQYFAARHPFERYRSLSRDHFAWEANRTGGLPVRVVFGVAARDTGDRRDPDRLGQLGLVAGFNLTSAASQRWLRDFCRGRGDDVSDDVRSGCFVDVLTRWMRRQCRVGDERRCCGKRGFPFPAHVFETCLRRGLEELSARGFGGVDEFSPGPRFDSRGRIRALVLSFPPPPHLPTSNFDQLATFYSRTNDQLRTELASAPRGLRDAWFVSDLELFALQDALYRGTVTSLLVSLAVALIVLLLTTLNLQVALLATVSIAATIVTSAGCLVLAGWELNVLESLTVAISVGLSVDFTAHFAIAYLAASGDRQLRVEHVARKLAPAVTLAALTTFAAGAGLTPSSILAYQRFGAFLMTVIATSWLFSTFFFLALLSTWGPQGGCVGPVCCCCACECVEPRLGEVSSDEHTTVMTDTSSLKAIHHRGEQQREDRVEIVERSTVI